MPKDLILGVTFRDRFKVVVDHYDRTAISKLKRVDCLTLENESVGYAGEYPEEILCLIHEVVVPLEHLKVHEAEAINALIAKYKPTLGREGLGCTDRYEHRIDTGDARPERSTYYSYSPKMLKIMQKREDEYLKLGVIEKSTSPWCSPVLLIPKPNPGKYRWVVSLKKVNKVAKPDSYSPYRVTDILDRLRDAKYLTSIDMRSAFWQTPLEKDSREKTAFMVPGRGLLQFTRLPQGLNSSRAAWLRFIDGVVGFDLQPHCFIYLDDLILVSSNFEEHLKLIDTVLGRLEKAKLTVNFEKSQFCTSELRYLGYIVDERGLRVCDDKVRAVKEFPRPNSIRQVRQFIGLSS